MAGASGHEGSSRVFLVVEDEPCEARLLALELRRYAPALVAASLAEARSVLRAQDALLGAIVDIGLPDGSGLELVAELRSRQPLLPVMVLTGLLSREAVNRAQALRAEFVCKPAGRENLDAFAQYALWCSRLESPELARLVQQLAPARQLTPREAELLALALQGYGRTQIAARFGVSEGTIKAHVRSILIKTGEGSLVALGQRILCEAWRGAARQR
ncbi:MAG: response regulator transcription factor [Deltaproteobacteria bacterium]|nr:response regulator transcription factor [Deltaproteobacteria bacterium]